MFWLLVKAALTGVFGSAFGKWFLTTRMGRWFQTKLDRFMGYLANKYDIHLAKKEAKWRTDFPHLANKIDNMESSADKYKGSSIVNLDTSIGGGNVPTHNTFTTHHMGTNEKGHRTEFGTNGTITLFSFEPVIQEAAQAPIKPFGGVEFDGSSPYRHEKPRDYRKFNSNTLMGNIQKGRVSSRYYRSLAIGNQNDILDNS